MYLSSSKRLHMSAALSPLQVPLLIEQAPPYVRRIITPFRYLSSSSKRTFYFQTDRASLEEIARLMRLEYPSQATYSGPTVPTVPTAAPPEAAQATQRGVTVRTVAPPQAICRLSVPG